MSENRSSAKTQRLRYGFEGRFEDFSMQFTRCGGGSKIAAYGGGAV